MDSVYEQLSEVPKWTVDDEAVKEHLEKILKFTKNPKLLRDQYDRRIIQLQKFPPPTPPYTIPIHHPTDPWIFWVYTEGHIRLKIQAYYQLWSMTCFITKINIDGL